jgi:hypothetical protein
VGGAVDLTVLPFAPEVRDTSYAHSAELRLGFERSAIWERPFSPAQLLERMEEAGVETVIVSAHTGGELTSLRRGGADRQHKPTRIRCQAGIDPRDISNGIRGFEAAVTRHDFVGAHRYRQWFGLAPDDRAY